MKKENILNCIGNTPLVKLNNIMNLYNLDFNLYAKLERNNPSGSVKDRAAYYIIKDGFEKGLINKDTIVVEATSGNTGISLSMICSVYQLRCVLFMPSSASIERVKMMKAYGSEVILTDKSLGMKGSVDACNEFIKNNKNTFLANQFENESNIKAHYETTSVEILNDLNNEVDVFIAGVGTSGTLIGNAKRFKEKGLKTKIIAVEPSSSPLLSLNKPGSHLIQGIGPNFLPKIYDKNLVDQVISVTNEEAYNGAKTLAKHEGILSGISSGAALIAALKLEKDKYKNQNIVIILPDNGERYLSIDGLYE